MRIFYSIYVEFVRYADLSSLNFNTDIHFFVAYVKQICFA